MNHRGIARIAQRMSIGTAFLHVGRASFPIVGKLTLDGRGAVRVAKTLGADRVVPIHHGRWSHFREPIEETVAAFEREGLGDLVWTLPPGRWGVVPP